MLQINSLTKHYSGSNKGVTELTLHVKKGDLCAFIGHNGAGKTTALKAISGIHSYEMGEIIIDGINIKDAPTDFKKSIAYIPDDPDLFEYLTGIQYLNFIADIFGISSSLRREKIKEFADLFEITDSLGNLISTYSHGMKQKLAIISALIHSPRLLILDEPFVGLDPKATLALKDIMRNICSCGGAVFFSTHVLDVAERLCNKVAIIKEGRLVKYGDMSEIVKDGSTLEDIFMEVSADE